MNQRIPINSRLLNLQLRVIQLYEAVCVLENKPLDTLEKKWPEIMEIVRNIHQEAGEIKYEIDRKRSRTMLTSLLSLPHEIRNFMEGL